MHMILYFLLILKPWEHGWKGVCGITIAVILKNEDQVQFHLDCSGH